MDPSILKNVMLPIVIVSVAILAPVAVVWIVMWFRQQRQDRLFETVRHFADKGLPVPRELIEPPPAAARSGSALSQALTLVGAGAGISLMFMTMEYPALVGIGALPACIGLGQLVALWVERQRGKA